MRGKAKTVLTSAQVRRIYEHYEEGVEPKVLAAQFGTTLANVTRIVRGQIWADVTGGRNISRHDAMVTFRKAYISSRWDQGCRSQAMIAAELGISRQAINRFMIRHSLGHHAQPQEASCSVE
jgi:hypothetical protein